MLTIRKEQLRIFEDRRRREFEQALARHIKRFFPHECERGDVEGFVRLGIDRAEYHGCETEREIALYLNLMAMLGSSFDEDPQIPWAGEQIDDPAIPGVSARIARVYASALGYQEEIAGPKNSHLIRALVRIRNHDWRPLDALDPDALPEAIAAELTAIYPEKASRHGEEAMAALAEAAIESAGARAARANRAAGIHALHRFILGSGYDRDPLYRWINVMLQDDEPGSPDVRFDKMQKTFLAYVNSILGRQS
jgi:hypothetical protein